MSSLRQTKLGLLDMAWYGNDPRNIDDVFKFEREVTKSTTLIKEPSYANTSCQFGHIFAGGYSAGYYSYKWAEVLDADAFDLFKDKGVFDQDIAKKFRDCILSKGGSIHPMKLYKNFRGREPEIGSLLKRQGIQ